MKVTYLTLVIDPKTLIATLDRHTKSNRDIEFFLTLARMVCDARVLDRAPVTVPPGGTYADLLYAWCDDEGLYNKSWRTTFRSQPGSYSHPIPGNMVFGGSADGEGWDPGVPDYFLKDNCAWFFEPGNVNIAGPAPGDTAKIVLGETFNA